MPDEAEENADCGGDCSGCGPHGGCSFTGWQNDPDCVTMCCHCLHCHSAGILPPPTPKIAGMAGVSCANGHR